MSSSYRLELNRFLQGLDVNAERVLDVGGSDLNVKGRTRSWNVQEYQVADLPQPHVGPKPDIEVDIEKDSAFYPCVDVEGEIIHENTYYEWADIVFVLEVFDYILHPSEAMNNIKSFMKPGAVAWITFPFVYPTHNPVESDMLRYTEFAVKRLAQQAGLEIEEIIKRRPETDAIEQLWRRERMRAAKNYDHNVTGFIVKFRKAKL